MELRHGGIDWKRLESKKIEILLILSVGYNSY